MPLSNRENYLRNVTFSGPEWIPCSVGCSGATWNQLRGELEDVLMKHPILFPGFQKGKHKYDAFDGQHKTGTFQDNWGCVWENKIDGIVGEVVGHPLASWEALARFKAPDPAKCAPLGPMDWEKTLGGIKRGKEGNQLTAGSVEHGFFLMRLWYLRGFENLMMDIASAEPRLRDVIRIVEDYNRFFIERYVTAGVDVIYFGEDLGAQTSSIISPRQFREWVAPTYRRLMQRCRQAGVHVFLHSDGHVMELMEQLIECGVNIVNPQDLVNGLDNLEREVKGRVCIQLDIDRQSIVPFGTRAQIRELIEEEVKRLGSPRGGLGLTVGFYPPTPPENIDAVCSAIEEFRTYWWDGRAR